MQKKTFKKIGKLLHFLIIVSILLSMTACSVEKTPSPTETTQESSPVPTETIQSPSTVPTQALTPSIDPTVEKGDVTISFSAFEFNRSIYEPIMEEFHQVYPSITVKFVATDANNGQSMTDYYKAATANVDGMDSYPNASNVKDFVVDLQPYMNSDPSFNQEDFYPDTLSACKDSQGHIRGIPVTLNIRGIFYDRSAFDAANLEYPQPGWTWDDFRNDVALLTQPQNGDIRYGYAERTSSSILEPIIGINLEKNVGVVDEKTLSAELQWYVNMAQTGQLLEIKYGTNDEEIRLADERWSAMFANQNGPALWYGYLISTSPALFGDTQGTSPFTDPAITRFGFVPFPISVDGSIDDTTPIIPQCFAISASSAHPEETWLWLSFLSQHLTQQWIDSRRSVTGQLLVFPARQSVAEDAGFWEGFSEENQTAIRYALEHAWYEGMYDENVRAVLTAVEKAANDGVDLTQAIAEAKVQLNAAK